MVAETDEDELQALRAELQELRDRQQQLVQAEKFAAVGLLAAEIAHEINNPATFVITNLTVMIDYVETIGLFLAELRAASQNAPVDAPEIARLEESHEIGFLEEDLGALLDRSLAGLHRIHQIVQDLRYFSADRRHESDRVDVLPLVRAALNLVRHEARFRAQLHADLPALPPVHADASRLGQVLLNVLVNAVQAIDAGDPKNNCVIVSAEVSDRYVSILVSDTGQGIDAAKLDAIFEPFYTTKPVGEGTGLGLAISRDIMRALGGDITARSERGAGSTFEIVIPRA